MSYAAAGLAGLQLLSGFHQAEMIRRGAKLQQAINNMNAEFAEIDAYDAEVAGFTEAGRYESVIDSTVGEQRAGYAAQNVDVNFGTAKEVQEETKFTGFLNQLDMLRQGRERAKGYKTEARNLRLGGQFTRMQGDMDASIAIRSGVVSAAQTGLSGYARSKG